MSSSKFKNAIGSDKKEKFVDCSVSTVSTEGRLIAVNGNFLAMSWSNMGEVVVVDSANPFRIKSDQPRIKGHRANVLDLEFSPFSSDLLAASFDDYSVLLYKIPEGGLKEHMTKEVQVYQKHTKKVPFVHFNPVASDVVCSGAFLGEIHVWNAIKAETYVELKADESPTIVRWNPNGTLIGATTKKKTINIFDPRANKMILSHHINDAFQSAKFDWLDNDTFATTSWTKAGAKTLKLWDVRKVKADLTSEGEVNHIQIDNSKTVTTPFADRDSKLLFCIGKGEATTHVYDYSEGKFKKGLDASSSEPSICSIMFERKCLDYNRLEVDRFARFVNSGKVYYISFNIPRRNPGFDPTLYPPVECGEAALSYDQWIGGQTSEPARKEINTIENKFVSKVEVFVKQEVKVEKKKPEDKIKELEGKIAEVSVKINRLTEENTKLKKQIETKKAQKKQTQNQKPEPEEPKNEEKQQQQNQKRIVLAQGQNQEEPKEEEKQEEQNQNRIVLAQGQNQEEPKEEEEQEEQNQNRIVLTQGQNQEEPKEEEKPEELQENEIKIAEQPNPEEPKEEEIKQEEEKPEEPKEEEKQEDPNLLEIKLEVQEENNEN